MNASRMIRPAALVLAACLACAAAAAQTIEELEKTAGESLKAKEALAEGYLRDCQLEKSLRLWREIQQAQPDHARAGFVVQRLTAQALDLDRQLDLIQTLLDESITGGVDRQLEAATLRAAGDDQKARILCLRGRLARQTLDDDGRGSFQAGWTLYGNTPWGARCAMELADALCLQLQQPPDPEQPETPDTQPTAMPKAAPTGPAAPGQPQRLLRAVILNDKLPAAVRQEGRLRLLAIDSQAWTAQQQLAALRELMTELTDPAVKRQALDRMIDLEAGPEGRWSAEAVDAAAAFLQSQPPSEQAERMLGRLGDLAGACQDAVTLDRLLKVLAELKPKDAGLAMQASYAAIEAMASRAVVETDVAAMRKLLAGAAAALDKLSAAAPAGERKRLWELRGRLLLVEAQKLTALAGVTEALPALMKAKEHFLAALPADPPACLERLGKIAALLEHVREWEAALRLHREIADRFGHLPEGKAALMKVAQLYEKPLGAPMQALEVYAEYASRYPAELAYRQLSVGRRLQRLGYANVLDFQKRNGLKVDGLFGGQSQDKLQELEDSFDMIQARQAGEREADRGEFVHTAIYRIARRLQQAGRDHQAIGAYLTLLNLFPNKKESDDALLEVARLFRNNGLFEEALGAYGELMEYLPNGDSTSEAYVESAACLENLGRWKQARELYELYVRKFPQYKHVPLCKERMALLGEIQQYEDFVAANPASPKAPEAQYQIATLLHKKLTSETKAAVEFLKVAQSWPRHVRAADALYTAGVAQLNCENFPAARSAFSDLVRLYADSRLADDAQFWIGHTHEYAARALGKLDDDKIVLRRRNLQHRDGLLADLPLRRRYFPAAQAGAEMPQEFWAPDALGVLASGSKRDRVNAELMQAIAAYRKAVDDFKMGDMAGSALNRIAVIYTDYLKDPEKGFQTYQELLAHYGGTKEAVDALYEVGAYYLKNKKYDEAIKACQQFIYSYPNDARVEDAMMAIAQCHMDQKAWDKALDAYQSCLSKFPQGKCAEKANAQIAWIRTYYY